MPRGASQGTWRSRRPRRPCDCTYSRRPCVSFRARRSVVTLLTIKSTQSLDPLYASRALWSLISSRPLRSGHALNALLSSFTDGPRVPRQPPGSFWSHDGKPLFAAGARGPSISCMSSISPFARGAHDRCAGGACVACWACWACVACLPCCPSKRRLSWDALRPCGSWDGTIIAKRAWN